MKAPHISTRPARILRHGLFTAALTPSLMPLHATTVLSPVNLLPAGSPGAIASQSSNPYGFPASRVNDGIVTGANPDFNHTNNALGEWVRLDLNADASGDLIRVINRSDCCADRLNGTVVRAFSDPGMTTNVFTSAVIAGSPARLNYRFPASKTVRVIELKQTIAQFLHVGEIQLFKKTPVVLPLGTNLGTAPLAYQSVSQSSTLGGFAASLALDGNNGNFTHTLSSEPPNPWWKADLGEMMRIQSVELRNRGDGCCAERLRDITVDVLDGAGAVLWTSGLLNPANALGSPGTILVDIQAANGGLPLDGRQVRVTRTKDPGGINSDDAGALSLGEVAITGGSRPDADADGMPDVFETAYGLNNGLNDGALDADSDGASNLREYEAGTLPNDSDTDNDGLTDAVETGTGLFVSAGDTGTNPLAADTDGDTLSDALENGSGTWVSAAFPGTNPNRADSDGDGFGDQIEDNSGVFVSAADPGTNPNLADTDSDLVNDRTEVLYGSNPNNVASTPITPGVPTLLAWWQFNDNSSPSVAVESRVGHAGSIQGAAAYSPDGEGFSSSAGDRSLRISGGGGKLRLENASAWINMGTRLDKLTVTFWQKNSAVTPGAGQSSMWFVSPGSADGARGFQAHCPWSDNTIYYDTGGASNPSVRINGPVSQDWSQWHHYVFLKDGVTKKVFVDGVERLSGTGSAALKTDFSSLNIGSDNGGGSMTGWIDEFAIFAAPLSAQNITDLAARTKTPADISTSSDADGDGLADAWEFLYFPGDLTKLGAPPADNDADGSTDANELVKNTDPTDPDSDDDTLLDGVETGTGVWLSNSSRGTSPLDADSDNDGLTDDQENNSRNYVSPTNPGTNPNIADTDMDGFRDNLEGPYGSDPNSAASVPFAPGQSLLLALWDFNNTSNPAAANDVVVGFPGASTGTYSLGGAGRSGALTDHAMCFDPDQAVTADGSFINLAAPGDAFTISFWQKLDTVRNSSAFWVSSPASGPASSFRGIQAHTPWSDYNIYFDHSGCCDPGIQRISVGLPAIDPTDWHHFALLKNGSTKRIYVDGILLMDGMGSAPLVNDLSTLTIGGGPAGYMDGCLDDFAIFAGGLTHEQICRLYAGESPRTILTPAAGGPFEITAVRLLAADQIQLNWNSTPGCTYRVEMSGAMTGGTWSDLAAGIPSGGNTTVATLTLPPALRRIFLRVTEQ